MNEYININSDNLAREHLCCAIADKKHEEGVLLKKEWLRERMKEGHLFRKLKVQGKVFIEFAPLDKAFIPVLGDNYLYIYCLWVAGSYKGKGYGNELLEYTINYAKEKKMNGVCLITSKKKKPFLSEKGFYIKKGFKVVDTVLDYELLDLNFAGNSPRFGEEAKKFQIVSPNLTIYYSDQCPYINNCIKEIKEYCTEKKIILDLIKIDTVEKAKKLPCIFNNWAVFKEGKYVTNVLLNRNSLDKLYN